MKIILPKKAINCMQHDNHVHKPIPKNQTVMIQDAKAAVDTEWSTLKNIPAWQESKVKGKQQMIEEARRQVKTVHFATLMDLCHLRNAELKETFQITKRRVVLCGNVVKT